jgi:hypothetical protein
MIAEVAVHGFLALFIWTCCHYSREHVVEEVCSPHSGWEAKSQRQEGARTPISLQGHIPSNLISTWLHILQVLSSSNSSIN